MREQPVAKEIVLIQTTVGLMIGLVCFNPIYENIRFVLEKKEFFEIEWPALVNVRENGLVPILLGISYITIQRNQIIWYSLEVPEPLLTIYKRTIPHPINVFKHTLPDSSKLGEVSQQKQDKTEKRKEEEKIIPFPDKRKN